MMKVYRCSVCGFSYRTKGLAVRCKAYCTRHGVCSNEITKHSIERSQG